MLPCAMRYIVKVVLSSGLRAGGHFCRRSFLSNCLILGTYLSFPLDWTCQLCLFKYNNVPFRTTMTTIGPSRSHQ